MAIYKFSVVAQPLNRTLWPLTDWGKSEKKFLFFNAIFPTIYRHSSKLFCRLCFVLPNTRTMIYARSSAHANVVFVLRSEFLVENRLAFGGKLLVSIRRRRAEPQKSRYSLKCSSLTQMPLMSNSHSVCRFVLRLHKLRNSSLYNPPKKEQSVSIPLPQMGDLEYFVEFRVKYMLAVFLAKIYLHCSSTCLLFSPIVSPCWWLPLRTLCDRVHFILESCV